MGKPPPGRARNANRSPESIFGEVLRAARLGRGYSQESLSFEAGYHRTYIGLLERGQKSPSLRTIVNLASVLGVKPWELLREMEHLDKPKR